MTLTAWIFILGAMWIGMLAYFSIKSYRQTESSHDYIFAGSSVGTFIGLMTFAATLFSTFTLMGMPDFFRVHGVGAWIFLAISDAAMFFLILGFGYQLRKRGREKGYKGVAGLMVDTYGTKWAGYAYFTGIFLFLVPYVAIQIRGIGIFFHAVFPQALPAWGWSVAIVFIMLAYSEVGGLRAILYSDTLQATVLLFVIWLIAVECVIHFGGVGDLFNQVKATNPDLLSTPGPQGLFTPQFLIASLFAIIMIPVTQPQITTRLVIMRDKQKLQRMAVALGIFTFLILLPLIFIGLYGSVRYGDSTTREFLSQVLLFEQPDIVAATVIIGLLAAAVSTSDSQIFALGTELRSLMTGDDKTVMRTTRYAIMFFGLAAMIFSIITTDELVLLARVSFAGTSMLGPLVLAGVFSNVQPGKDIIALSFTGLVLFLASLVDFFPDFIGPFRLDLFLLVVIGGYTAVMVVLRNKARTTA